MRRWIVGVATLHLLAGCTAIQVTVPLQLTSRRDFPAQERSRVWGRAVTAFQITGRIVALTDSLGGVLQSETQRSSVPCTIRDNFFSKPDVRWCPAVEFAQFTVSDDGIAFLRVNRRLQGQTWRYDDVVVTEENMKWHQSQIDLLLDYIVGVSREPPAPPSPPLSADVVRI